MTPTLTISDFSSESFVVVKSEIGGTCEPGVFNVGVPYVICVMYRTREQFRCSREALIFDTSQVWTLDLFDDGTHIL